MSAVLVNRSEAAEWCVLALEFRLKGAIGADARGALKRALEIKRLIPLMRDGDPRGFATQEIRDVRDYLRSTALDETLADYLDRILRSQWGQS